MQDHVECPGCRGKSFLEEGMDADGYFSGDDTYCCPECADRLAGTYEPPVVDPIIETFGAIWMRS
jgi:hypothetical protein